MNELSISVTDQNFPPGYLTILTPQNPTYKPIPIQYEMVLIPIFTTINKKKIVVIDFNRNFKH